MTRQQIQRAIVLAAGTGSRLRFGGGAPKPLREVGGQPLLVRVLKTLKQAGIEEAVVVVGFEGQAIERRLARERLGLTLRFVYNDDYERQNGVSLLAAADYVDRPCILTMSDHLYSPELVRRMMHAATRGVGSFARNDALGVGSFAGIDALGVGPFTGIDALGVDYDVARCFDLDDATKVLTQSSGMGAARVGVAKISKELTEFDAIDTGVFLIGPAFIEALRAVEARSGDCSLSEGVRYLAERNLFSVCDVGDVRWIDVDTPAALERAEAMLRVFGEDFEGTPGHTLPPPPISPEAVELFAPSWVRAATPYNEDHFAVADSQRGLARLMANENPFGPSPKVIQAIVEAAALGNRYPMGAAELRTLLSARDGLGQDNVILGAGSTELIDVIVRTFVGPGEEAILGVPTFSMYEARTRVSGGIPVLVPVNEHQDYDVPAIIRSVNERSKVLFLCSPNNPTGRRIPESDLRRLLGLGLPTVIDEAYAEFGEGLTHAPLLREFPNAIILRTLSKAYGMAGLRLGYALANEKIIHLMRRVKVPWNIPGVTIAGICALLREEDEFASRMEEMERLRLHLADGLRAIPGLRILPGEGNFVLIDVSETGRRAPDIVAELLSQGVLIRDLSAHHATQNHVRVTVGKRSDNERCVAGFARVMTDRAPSKDRPEPVYVSLGDAE